MAKNRVAYFAALLCCALIHLMYRQWMGWILLLTVLLLPFFSLLCSLPALLTMNLRLSGPRCLLIGEPGLVSVVGECRFPLPYYRCRLEVQRTITAEQFLLEMGGYLPTDHCGDLRCRVKKAWAYDYLGLFRFRLRSISQATFKVRPIPDKVSDLPNLKQPPATVWRPKPGGGFAENHEMRLYRPGDKLNQIHWKLSAKTGKPIVREPMIPQGRQAVITLCITGSGAVLDRKFARLLGVSRYLLLMDIPHYIEALTGSGLQKLPVDDEQSLMHAVDELLGATPTDKEQTLHVSGVWSYQIGGNAHE